ncbi:MAG TPA: putative glycoside hydrolase [Gemmatimonadales bacterium]|nr:putative glycoside hydrolase [Gemmatimonadales bacterium]
MRQCLLTGLLLTAAAIAPDRGVFAQSPERLLAEAPSQACVAADASRVALLPTQARFTRREFQWTRPGAVKALYVNAWAFGSSRLWTLVRLADSSAVNALVIDVKDDTGCLLYHSQVRTAREIGADRCARTRDVEARLDTLHAHGIYPIARIVVAKDPLLARGKPAWSVQSRNGGLWYDRIGSAWVDAYNDSVWVYSGLLAQEAIRLGFAEVQFDYVRFPDEPRARMATAIFAARRGGETQREAVRRHIQMLADYVRPMGVPVTFDVFGLTASNTTSDLGIGQVWEDFVGVADVVLPMVYPSHYYRGAFGFRSPNANPYQVVRLALTDALARTRFPSTTLVRPYLQAFTLGRRLPRYTPTEIRDQIRAAQELGLESWVLWNPRSVYLRAALPPYPSVAGRVAASGATGGE